MSIITPPGILAYPVFYTPRVPPNSSPGTAPRYSCVLVFTPEHQEHPRWAEMRQAAQHAVSEKWGGKVPPGLKWGVRPTSEKASFSGFPEGSKFVSFWTKHPVGVIDANGADIIEPDRVFAGQTARVSFRPWCYDTNGNRGVSYGLEHVQVLILDADRMDGRANARDTFAGEDTPSEYRDAAASASAGHSAEHAMAEEDIPF